MNHKDKVVIYTYIYGITLRPIDPEIVPKTISTALLFHVVIISIHIHIFKSIKELTFLLIVSITVVHCKIWVEFISLYVMIQG